MSTQTHPRWCLYSFRLSHTPHRSHFLCQPAKLQLSLFPSIPLLLPLGLSSPLSERWAATTTHVWHVVAFQPTQTQNRPLKEKSQRTCIPDVLPNVLMWLNVPSTTTTLNRNGLWGVVSRSALWRQTMKVLWLCWLTLRRFSWFD